MEIQERDPPDLTDNADMMEWTQIVRSDKSSRSMGIIDGSFPASFWLFWRENSLAAVFD
jgi:hypothetical protein